MSFLSILKDVDNISFERIREVAASLLPLDRTTQNKLRQDLLSDVGMLDDDDHLNMYLHSFGQLHKARLDAAFDTLPDVASIFGSEIEVYDWSGKQGLATVCLLDFLKSKSLTSQIKQICLIDPSVASSSRARDIISSYNSEIEVSIVGKTFEELSVEDFKPTERCRLHLFNNVLGVVDFDLMKFMHLIQTLFDGDNYFLCVGPYYDNNRQIDDFLAAIEPDTIYASFTKDCGLWINDWSISVRVFFKHFSQVDSVQNIRKRIEKSHKKVQFFAGYILDAVSEEYVKTDLEDVIEILFNSLSSFDVKSDCPFVREQDMDPKLCVLANIISRGLPTKAPLLLEDVFADLYGISNKPKGGLLNYPTLHKITRQEIYEALHVIDPRFDLAFYNVDMLDSSFEQGFIDKYLTASRNEYLAQILEPQRPLSTIVEIPNRSFSKDQRVDFSLEIPYGNGRTGFILELDGAPYHSSIFQRLNDRRRDEQTSRGNWDTYRVEELTDIAFMQSWESDAVAVRYLAVLKGNYAKALKGKWRDTLQVVLAPLAIARVERTLVEAMMSGTLNVKADTWNIAVVERDIPCAALAMRLLQEKYTNICVLAGSEPSFPQINLCIVSSEEFKESPLHLDQKVVTVMPQNHFDLCIDVSVFLRDNIDALPLNILSRKLYIIRSSHYKKRDRTICTAENIKYPPLVRRDSTGSYLSIPEREAALTFFLRDIFRKSSFRPGQLPIISHALGNMTTIGLLPTGGGKSLTYQISCLLQPGVSIVVDPLVSLMVDQVRGLRDIRIDACDCVNSGMDAIEKAQKLNLLQNGALLFMLLSPERFMMENFRASLITMTEKNHVFFAYGIIDEVHCVSEWGHDFRTSYLHLGRNMINFMSTKSGEPLAIIGLTATASFDVLADVERELTLGGNLSIDSEAIVRPESDNRPELTYRVLEIASDFDELRSPNEEFILKAESDWDVKAVVATAKRRRMYELFEQIPFDIEQLNATETEKTKAAHIEGFAAQAFYSYDSSMHYSNAGIIFCPHAHGIFGVQDNEKRTTVGVATELRLEKQGLAIGTFIGGDSPSGDMQSFNENDQNVMVATKAFGMGIDKPNIRYTIHINHPASIESYVQEAGRGGRDKRHAISYILFDSTEYLHLTYDKLNDIRASMGQDDFDWLERYANKFILAQDIPAFCYHNGATESQVQKMQDIIQAHRMLENIDKDINLWFHNNSFRGLYKEKVILHEMTDGILNVKPTILTEAQRRLREITGNEDLCLKVLSNKGLSICSQENIRQQYGYIFLDNLQVTYKRIAFDYSLCQYVCNTLIDILKLYPEHTPKALLRPLDGTNKSAEGIYSAMTHADKDGYVYVVVSWENQIKQDPEQFELKLKQAISEIAKTEGWLDINESRYGKLEVDKINDFSELLARISKCSDDARWLRYYSKEETYVKLKRIFCEKRDKNDTDKAIYRMCCIGLVEDVTIDYLSQTYELKIRKRSDEEFRQFMIDFFSKYYSLEQSKKRVAEIDQQKGRNYLDKCLGYLTTFVYNNLEKKRYRAIEDMRIACEDSITARQADGNDEWLKEFIHLYFNSKYARTMYEVDGKSYSLMVDTDHEAKDDYSIVKKYIEIIPLDSSGSEVDNVKHLYGATLLCLRAHPDNAALQLLLTYCITFLGAGDNETLKANAYNNYIEAFMTMYKNEGAQVWEHIDSFHNYLVPKVRESDTYIEKNIIDQGKKTLMLLIHDERVNDLRNRYLA